MPRKCKQPQRATAASTSGYLDLLYAKVDLCRRQRQGFPEVIYCQGKTPTQAATIFASLAQQENTVLATRATPAHAKAIRAKTRTAVFDPVSSCVFLRPHKLPHLGTVAVLSAGTSDGPVAEEAAITVECFGAQVERVRDVGVAGLHRLLAQAAILTTADVFIVVAGMEGALPSVVSGLVDKPVIAVPTSVGYGANLGGIAALLGMLTSCGSGVTVVNIDNGFGAGFAAGQILRLKRVAKE